MAPPNDSGAASAAASLKDEPKPWHKQPITGDMLKAAIHLLAGRATAVDTTKKIMDDFEKLMDSGDPAQAVEILKPEKRARGRPRIRPPEEERKHRDLGPYNLFVMKAQNVAGTDVKNHRAFMALIGSYWKGMDQETRDSFNATYRGLLDQLNDKKKHGNKFDFPQELRNYEAMHTLDTHGYFQGFLQQVKALPPPETKQEKEARLHSNPAIPAPAEEEDDDDGDDDLDDLDPDVEHGLPKKRPRKTM